MPAQVVSQASSVDWNIIAGAIATFLVTALIAWTGRREGKKLVEQQDRHSMPAIMSGVTLQDNYSLVMSTEASRALADELKLTRNSNERLIDSNRELCLEIERLTRRLSP